VARADTPGRPLLALKVLPLVIPLPASENCMYIYRWSA
jgi:hypothetical protein